METEFTPGEQLQVRVQRIQAPPDLLSLVPKGADLLCWFGPECTVVGWGDDLRFEFSGADAITDAARTWDRVVRRTEVHYQGLSPAEVPGKYPLALASFGFAASTPGVMIVPRIAFVHRAGETFLVTAARSGEPAPAASPELNAALQEGLYAHPPEAPSGLWTDPGRMTQRQWVDAVQQLTILLRSGAASKVVLARDIAVSSPLPIDQRYLAGRLLELYPTTWVYAVEGLIGATPEMLAAKTGTQVVSRILAGTSAPHEGESLLASSKNLSEHHFAVESVARALSPIADQLDIPNEPGLLELPNVTHLVTEIRAEVPEGNLLDIVAALHPTAAVCGSPRKLAFDILSNIEGTRRGRYSGPVGWIDGTGGGEFGIALRCGQLTDDGRRIRIFAGGGIMPDSVPAVELAETRAKMKPVLQAIGLEN